MSKLFILSIQGGSYVTVNGCEESHGQGSLKSYIKVLDIDNNKELTWKLGVFTQAKHEIHEDDELEALNELGFNADYIHPWDDSKNGENCIQLLTKLGFYDEDKDDDGNIIGATFDGYIFIGEIEEAKAKELSEKYMQSYYVY